MTSERKKLLQESLKKINKEYGKSFVKLAKDNVEKEKISTGIKEFDDFIGGGIVCGNFTVIYGGESVGKSTITLQTIANAQKEGKICCYIDLEHSFSKKRAKVLGVDLEELVLAEDCDTAEQAEEIIRTLAQDKVADLIVVDSIQAMATKGTKENKGKDRPLEDKEIAELARNLSKFFKVVSPDVFRAKMAVIMVGQVRIGGIGTFFTRATMTGGEALKHFAYTRVFMRRGQTADAPYEKIKVEFTDPTGKERYKTEKKFLGFDCVFKLEKTKSSDSQTEGSQIHLPFYYAKGFKQKQIIPSSREKPDVISLVNEKPKKRGRPKKDVD